MGSTRLQKGPSIPATDFYPFCVAGICQQPSSGEGEPSPAGGIIPGTAPPRCKIAKGQGACNQVGRRKILGCGSQGAFPQLKVVFWPLVGRQACSPLSPDQSEPAGRLEMSQAFGGGPGGVTSHWFWRLWGPAWMRAEKRWGKLAKLTDPCGSVKHN